jgi:transposase
VDTQDEGLALEMGVPVSRPRRFFSPEYKAEVVELIRSTGKTTGQVARELDLTETAVREWVKRADLDAGRRSDGLTTVEREELRRLRREVRELREEREILRKAAVFFALERPAIGGHLRRLVVGRVAQR